MDQNQSSQYFPNGQRLLRTIDDPRVSYAVRVKPEKIVILRDDDPSGGSSERQMGIIPGANQTCIRRGGNVDIPPT